MKIIKINQNLTLPCGAVIKNRLAKSAMSENMAYPNFFPNQAFERLYQTWSEGETGLVITGNVMIDSSALGEPHNIVIEENLDNFRELQQWAKAGTKNGNHLWVQLNHPGKQSPKFLSKTPVAPSAIELNPPLNNLFNCPRELSDLEIRNIIQRFAYAAEVVKRAGFTGVQIHGAHGYLVSQFLSPKHNHRDDYWGGDQERRMNFVIEVYKEIRKSVGDEFPIGIKLNSADFQKGGFSEDESLNVVKNLSKLGIDLIEISGGTYEAPVMMEGQRKKDSTIKREAYFLDYCEKISKLVSTPLLLTGGFRTLKGMNEALESGACQMIGLARSLAIDPDFSKNLLKGKLVESPVKPLTSGIKAIDKLVPIEITWYTAQLHRMGKGLSPNPNASVKYCVLKTIFDLGFQSIKRTRA